MSINDAHVLSTEPLDPQKARWTQLKLVHYSDPAGNQRTWESAERRTRPANSAIDGVGIVAILQEPHKKPALLLQKQFRPPVNKVCIEVPAGLVDEGETGKQAAIRELKEETGYIASFDEETPVMFNDPGFCNTNLTMVHVKVDMRLPENQAPRPSLEPNEYIDCFTVPLDELYAECRRLEQEGYAIDARVGTLAEGIEIAKRWGLTSFLG